MKKAKTPEATPDGEGLEPRGVTLEDVQIAVNHLDPIGRRVEPEQRCRPSPVLGRDATPRESRKKVPAAVALVSLMLLFGPSLRADEPLRVGTSGDYEPFSVLDAESLAAGGAGFRGFDPELARAYAQDRGLEIVFVQFKWPNLVADLVADRFDLAMSGITIRPERSLVGRFSVPIFASGAVALVAGESGLKTAEDLNRSGLEIAVNAGGHLERVAKVHFPRANLRAIPNNEAVIQALVAGEVQVAITDTQEAPHWRQRAAGLRAIGPFTRDRKAYLMRADKPDLARDFDAWLLDREARGDLDTLRKKYLGDDPESEGITSPLPALLAAIDERLGLMPLVAEAKRHSGEPVDVPDREVRVLAAAVAGVRRAELEFGSTPLSEAAIRQLFRAQIEAAKWLQRDRLAQPAGDGAGDVPDLEGELRPALIRIGDRISRLLVGVPAEFDAAKIESATLAELSSSPLPLEAKRAIARGLLSVARDRKGK